MTLSKPLSVEEICDKLRPLFGKKIDELYFRYTMANSRDEKEEIAHLFNALYQKNLSRLLDKRVLLEPPKEDLMNGDYPLAKINYAGRDLFDFRLREEDWQRHICISGMSGSGKTTFAFKIIEELNRHNKAFLIFDWKKSFRPLIREIPDLMVFTIGDKKTTNLFKMNINEPPTGISPKEWIGFLVDLLTESFSVSFGVHKVLLETLDEAFKEWGVYHGSKNYPTWNHIKYRLEEKMEKTQGREAGWIESALRIATVLTFGDFGEVVNYKGDNKISVEDLLNKKVVMELNSLGNVEKKFFCEFILMYIYKFKKAENISSKRNFDYAILVDEAHNIFLKRQTNFADESITDAIYREMREYGTGLICLDQHISKISDSVKGNSACHISFQQQLPQDIDDISSLMQLKEKKHYFSILPVGTAIVKLSERYPFPFLIHAPFSEIKSCDIGAEEIKKRMEAMLLNYEFEKGVDKDFNSKIMNPSSEGEAPVKEAINLVEEQKEAKDIEAKDNFQDLNLTKIQLALYDFANEKLSLGFDLKEIEHILEQKKDELGYSSKDILKVINILFENQFKEFPRFLENGQNSDEDKMINFLRENPNHNLSTVEIYRALGFSARKGTKIKNELQKKGIIKIEEIRYDRGRKKIIRLASNFPTTNL